MSGPLRRESIAEFRAEAMKLLSLGGMIKREWTCFHRVVRFLVPVDTQVRQPPLGAQSSNDREMKRNDGSLLTSALLLSCVVGPLRASRRAIARVMGWHNPSLHP